MDRSAFADHAWDQMLALYQHSGIPALCLGLQSDDDVDVPLLLLLALADHAGQRATPEAVSDLIAEAADWRELAVRPLRSIRVALKPHVATPAEAAFRDAIKQLELQAERLHVERLAQYFAEIAEPKARSGPGGLAAQYLAERRMPKSEADAALAAINTGLAQVLDRAPAS